MNPPASGIEQYLARFENQTIACSPYALTRMGLDRSHCVLKIEDYVILCAPFQLSFKRSILLASLSKQELTFFQRYKNALVGLSMEFAVANRQDPLKLFVRGSLSEIGQMKGRENVGLLVVDFKSTPDDLITIIGSYLESQERFVSQYEDYGKTPVRITPDTAKMMGYNMYAVANDRTGSQRIQLFSLSSKSLEYLEAAHAHERTTGTEVSYQLFFRKYRIQIAGKVDSVTRLASGVMKTRSSLSFSPELVEILDDYWFRDRAANRATGQ